MAPPNEKAKRKLDTERADHPEFVQNETNQSPEYFEAVKTVLHMPFLDFLDVLNRKKSGQEIFRDSLPDETEAATTFIRSEGRQIVADLAIMNDAKVQPFLIKLERRYANVNPQPSLSDVMQAEIFAPTVSRLEYVQSTNPFMEALSGSTVWLKKAKKLTILADGQVSKLEHETHHIQDKHDFEEVERKLENAIENPFEPTDLNKPNLDFDFDLNIDRSSSDETKEKWRLAEKIAELTVASFSDSQLQEDWNDARTREFIVASVLMENADYLPSSAQDLEEYVQQMETVDSKKTTSKKIPEVYETISKAEKIIRYLRWRRENGTEE